MIITNCPRCGSMNATTTCTKCGWSQFTTSTVSTRITGEIEIMLSGKALLDDYKRLLLENRNLKERVAELESEVAELKPYRDGYDPKKVFPPEAEWVWMRDCDDNIEPVQYNHIAEIYWNYMPGDCDELYCYWHPNDDDIRRWYPIGKLPEERER